MAVSVEHQYRRFLVWTAVATYLAAAVELLILEHYEDLWQFSAFVLIGVGLAVLAWLAKAPGPRSARAVWVGGVVVMAGSLLGVVLHVKGNAQFAMEIDPGLGLGAALWEGVTGASPFLAPGMVALAAALGMAAAWRHPTSSTVSFKEGPAG